MKAQMLVNEPLYSLEKHGSKHFRTYFLEGVTPGTKSAAILNAAHTNRKVVEHFCQICSYSRCKY